MAGTGGTTTYTPMSVLTGTTLLPKKPVVVAAKPTVTATKAPTTLQSLMSSTSGSSSSSSSKPKTTTSTASASSSAPKLTSAQKTAITSLAGLPAALPAANKNAISSAFLNALAQAARTGGAVSNPPGLSGAEADKLRSQFYSNMPVQRIVDNTGSPQAMLSYDVNKRIDPALLNSLSSPFGVETPPLPMVPGGTGIGFGQTPAAGFPATAVAPFMTQGIRPGQPSGLPAAPFMAQGVRPGTPAGMPAAPFVPQGVRPGQPSGLPAAPVPPAPAGGGYNTDMLNSKGIARYLIKDLMPQTATSQAAPQQGVGFDPMSLLVGQAYGAELPANYGGAPTTRSVPTMNYTGNPGLTDVLLSQLSTGVGLGSDKDRLTLANPFYQQKRVGATNPILGDAMATPEANNFGASFSPMTSSFVPGDNQIASLADLNEVMAPRVVAGQRLQASPMEDALIAQGIKPGIPMDQQDPSGKGRLVTDPFTGITREAGSTQTAGYDPLLSYDMVKLFQQGPSATPVASVVPRERPSLFDFAVSNPGWAIEKMRAIEDAGTMADNSDYGNLVSGLENSPNRTADMMSQSAKLRAAEEYANANDIPVSDTYGGAEDKTDQLLNIYEEKVAPTLPKSGGTTAGAVFKPGAGQFVGTNGYVYEQSGDGSFKQVGKVPGYTDAQLYEAANKGAFSDPNNIPVGKAKTVTRKPGEKNLLDMAGDVLKDRFDDSLFSKMFLGGNKNATAPWGEASRSMAADLYAPETMTYASDRPMMDGSPSSTASKSEKKKKRDRKDDGEDTGGTSGTGGTGSTDTGTYTPPTQQMIDALYAPYFRNAAFPGAEYLPGVSAEFNYFPRFAEGGAVPDARLVLGHGGPTSDNIPANIDGVQEARLSNGEFVMTAAAVKNAGDGDMTKGAERLMHLNQMLSYGRPANKLNVETVKGKAK